MMSSNQPQRLRFRQIHLDFHTSPAIPDIGKKFDKSAWQETLTGAAVDSVTLFAKCHHGWSYHPTEVGRMHPHLDFDLLRAQYEATKECGINAPIYLSAGVDNVASTKHPGWREVDKEGRYAGWARTPLEAGFHLMDFHSPYLDYLCDQIREVVRLFPDCDGIFLDIIMQSQSCSPWSLEFMRSHGLDPASETDRTESSRLAIEKYYKASTAAARSARQDMPVFHNSGHIPRGRQEILPHFSHLELESLPTGGWGYDHFPMSAKYACNLPLEFLGMTGKFHTTWGEFGGYKHPNALRYECSAMLALGSKCSIGDQLHPSARLDRPTYEIIGTAYREVREKEPWCVGARQVFDIAILSSESENGGQRDALSDEGACRAFLESHLLFGLVDRSMDFTPFKGLVLPDDIRIDEGLKTKLDAYVAAGGKLILSGDSGLWRDREEFAFDLGADHAGLSPFYPPDSEPNRGHDYLSPAPELMPSFPSGPQIMYERSRRIRVTTGQTLGAIHDPFFNRTWEHFCSHQHTPYREEASGYDCGVRHGSILYFAHPVFRNYRCYGAVVGREFIIRAILDHLGPDARTVEANIPSTARITLTYQPAENRHVLHLLYAPTINRGSDLQLPAATEYSGKSIEVIEDLIPLHDINIDLRLAFQKAALVPSGEPVPVARSGGVTRIHIDAFSSHQMIELRS